MVQKGDNEMRKNTEYKYIHHILHERHVAICADIWTANGMPPQLQMVADRKSIHPKLTSVRLAELFCQVLRWQYFDTFKDGRIFCALILHMARIWGMEERAHSLYSAAHNEGKW